MANFCARVVLTQRVGNGVRYMEEIMFPSTHAANEDAAKLVIGRKVKAYIANLAGDIDDFIIADIEPVDKDMKDKLGGAIRSLLGREEEEDEAPALLTEPVGSVGNRKRRGRPPKAVVPPAAASVTFFEGLGKPTCAFQDMFVFSKAAQHQNIIQSPSYGNYSYVPGRPFVLGTSAYADANFEDDTWDEFGGAL